MIRLYLLLFLQVFLSSSIQAKPKLTFDEYFDVTAFPVLSFSPTSQHLLIETVLPSWNTSSYDYALWVYDIRQQTRKLITKNSHKSIKPQWSPNSNWIALLLDETPANATDTYRYQRSLEAYPQTEQYIYLYSLSSDELLPIPIGTDIPLAMTWSDNESSIYLATLNLQPAKDDEELNREEWKDVIRYRQNKIQEQSTIYRIDINYNDSRIPLEKIIVKNISFLIGELLFVPLNQQLICASASQLIEDLEGFELYSIDLRNSSASLTQLTDNEAFESNIEISKDGQQLLFILNTLSPDSRKMKKTQPTLNSLNLINGQITRLAENFNGHINEYAIRSDGNVYIVGQLGTEIQMYSQRLLSKDIIQHSGWNGTYESITLSNQDLIAFVYSSTEKPMEIYLSNDISQLLSAKPITNDNVLYTQRDLPRTKIYQWKNEDDHQIIEGILHYPPGKFEAKDLPLLVLMHGGPYAASVNRFLPDWYTWAPLAASEGWLVLEPNYRGSSGYGDQFLDDIRYRPLSLPGKDILYGVDQLIRDGIVDPYKLAVGGYSYGGFLTNWLITQTKRFNAALSGAGSIDHLSAWGTMDLPVLLSYLFGGYPWESPHIYQNEAPIYQLDRVRTPTLIITGERDIRVPASQSYIMERGLYYRGVPVKLITFQNEDHDILIDPWHGKIKIREELKWLEKYGHQLHKNE